MELLFVAIGIGFICMIAIILFCLCSRSKERYVYCRESKQFKGKGSVKNVHIEGFMK